MTSTLRTATARASLLTALLAAFALLFAGTASAQVSDDCYPVPADGCDEPEVQPSVVESPTPAPEPTPGTENPAPEPTSEVAQQVDADTDDAVLASTGIESPALGLVAGALVLAGAAAVVVARRRETVDA